VEGCVISLTKSALEFHARGAAKCYCVAISAPVPVVEVDLIIRHNHNLSFCHTPHTVDRETPSTQPW